MLPSFRRAFFLRSSKRLVGVSSSLDVFAKYDCRGGRRQFSSASPTIGVNRKAGSEESLLWCPQGRRPISNLSRLKDVILQRPNPILQHFQEVGQTPDETAQTTTTISVGQLPPPDKKEITIDLSLVPKSFSKMEPHHAKAAIDYVLKNYENELQSLQETFADSFSLSSSSSSMSVQEFFLKWSRIQVPVFQLDSLLLLFVTTSSPVVGNKWKQAYALFEERRHAIEVDHLAPWVNDFLQTVTEIAHKQQLDHALSKTTTTTTTETTAAAAAAASLSPKEMERATIALRYYVEQQLSAPSQLPDAKKIEEYEKLHNALVETNHDFLEHTMTKTTSSSANNRRRGDKPTIAMMYTMLGLSHDKAKLLGFPNRVAEVQTIQGRIATATQIEVLLQTISQRLLPAVHQLVYPNGKKPANGKPNSKALEEYLTNSKNETAAEQLPNNITLDPHPLDQRFQIRLENFVTLDGAMNFLSTLLTTVFGVALVRHNPTSGMMISPVVLEPWDDSVHLYHCYDTTTHQHIGSVFIDPFQREGKEDRPCTIPLAVRQPSPPSGGQGRVQVPVLVILLQLQLPTWDNDPGKLTYLDLRHLFHEMGHVLQFILHTSPHGYLVGPQVTPRDFLEVVPTFMEKWLLEKSTIYGLIAASDVSTDFVDDSIDALYRVVQRQTYLNLAETLYLATLEYTLFSGFDLRGSETIMQLQNRLGQDIVPHQQPATTETKDVTALIQVMSNHAAGHDPLSNYGYLWADAVSSTIFQRIKLLYEQDSSQMPKLKQQLRQSLLHPGAAVPWDKVKAEWELEDKDNHISTDAMFELYGIVDDKEHEES